MKVKKQAMKRGGSAVTKMRGGGMMDPMAMKRGGKVMKGKKKKVKKKGKKK
mgnify:CR=1 FL=1